MPQLRITSPRGIAGLVVASAALLFSVAACGGGSDGTPATGGDNQDGGGRNTAFAAYTECLAENGVTITMPSGGPRVRPSGGPSGLPRPSGSARPGGGGFPGGGFGKPAGVDDATWENARQACASVLPSGRPGGNGRGNGMSAAYRNCLQDNGVTLGQGAPATNDPAVRKAVEACRALAPTASAAPPN
ncbi:hypothetical protein AB0C12_35735 [Actinoplanes sp. NPDC048967]|uniref:hypothetical protein n=1 Tax=Actinoplanes sp. NPDC048967 TaxID=3155269 RepID=UPI0033ECE751